MNSIYNSYQKINNLLYPEFYLQLSEHGAKIFRGKYPHVLEQFESSEGNNIGELYLRRDVETVYIQADFIFKERIFNALRGNYNIGELKEIMLNSFF